MKITQISLTNFRSFKDTQVIDLAPVTLMFGPNSAGKSSVFSALFYIQQILEKKQCDPMYIDTLNKKYVGGFENLVYKRDLDSTIKINIKYEVGETKSKSYTYLYPLIEKELDIKLESPVKKTISISTEFEIAWSRVKNKAYIKTYIVYFEDVEVAITECDDDLKPSITFLNYIHPLLWPKNHSEWLKEQEVSKASVHVYNQLEIYGIDNYDDEPKDPIVNGEMLGIDSIITVNLLTGKIELDLDQSIEHYREIYPNEDFDGDKYIGYINEVLPKKLNDKLSFN